MIVLKGGRGEILKGLGYQIVRYGNSVVGIHLLHENTHRSIIRYRDNI